MIDLTGRHALILGTVDTSLVGIAKALRQVGAATSFAFGVEEGEEAIRLIGEHQLRPERMRAVNFSSPAILTMQLSSFEPLDIVILEPRWRGLGPFLETQEEGWKEALRLNVEETTYLLQASAELFLKQGKGGRIITIIDIASLTPLADSSVLATSHALLHDICDRAALELAPAGITVNVLASGWLEAGWAEPMFSAERQEQLRTEIPLGGFGQAKDLGQACCFLASKAARYITGITLPVDGGYLLGRQRQGVLANLDDDLV